MSNNNNKCGKKYAKLECAQNESDNIHRSKVREEKLHSLLQILCGLRQM